MADETAVKNATPESNPTPDATPSSGSDTGSGGGAAPWDFNPSYLDNGGAQGTGTQSPMAPPSGQAFPPAPQDAKSDMQAPVAPIPVVHPVRRSGLAGIVDEIRDAIAGKTQTNIGTDAQGNKYVKTTDLTGGQKWARIASTVLHGAAAGMANGQGPGGAGRALAAGVNVADKQTEAQKNLTKEQQEEVKKDQLDKFNMIKLKHDVAASAFALTRMQVKASQDDITFAQQQNERERTLGSADLGIFKDPADLASVQQKDPQFWKNVYANNVVTVPEIDPETGKRNGIHVYLRTPGIGSQLAPKGTPIMDYVPGEKPTDAPKLVSRVPTIPMTHDQVDQQNNASHAKYLAWQTQQQDLKDKTAQAAQRQSEVTKNNAEANKSNAEANEANAKAKQTVDASPLADEIGTGHMAVGRMAYLMARNSAVLEQVAKKYPDFDSSKVDAYAKTYQDFTSGHTSTALNAGGTALAHLSELQALNTPMSHVPHSPEWTAYQNKAATVSTELAKFYGDATIPAIAQIKDTLTSTLPGNRDKAIKTQAQSMGDKLDSYKTQWDNAAPSKAYQANMPDISPRAKEARAALDPKYKARYVEELSNSPQQQPTAAPPAPSGMVGVQIPGQPPGHIPQAALDQFKKDHPNAQVTQ